MASTWCLSLCNFLCNVQSSSNLYHLQYIPLPSPFNILKGLLPLRCLVRCSISTNDCLSHRTFLCKRCNTNLFTSHSNDPSRRSNDSLLFPPILYIAFGAHDMVLKYIGEINRRLDDYFVEHLLSVPREDRPHYNLPDSATNSATSDNSLSRFVSVLATYVVGHMFVSFNQSIQDLNSTDLVKCCLIYWAFHCILLHVPINQIETEMLPIIHCFSFFAS